MNIDDIIKKFDEKEIKNLKKFMETYLKKFDGKEKLTIFELFNYIIYSYVLEK